ncbi:MAG: hypothetical protein ABIP06_11040 [Pyrinomonadaceae bacterium]
MSALIQAGMTPGNNVITVTGEAYPVPGVSKLEDSIELTVIENEVPAPEPSPTGRATTLGLTLAPL